MRAPWKSTPMKSIARTRFVAAVIAAAALPALGAGPAASVSSSDEAKVFQQKETGYKEIAAADQSFAKIAESQVAIQRLVGRINALTRQIAANNQAIAGLNKLNPTKALEVQAKALAAAKSGATAWFPSDNDVAAVPSLAMAQKKVADVQQEISAKQSARGDLEKQRGTASTQAQQLFQQADGLNGQQGLDVYTQACAQRKSAADLTAQMEDIDAKLALLQKDLSLAQARQKQAESAVARIEELTKATNDGWAATQKQIESYTAMSTALLNGSGAATQPSGPPASVADALAALNAEVTAVAANRTTADTHLTAASSAFSQAANASRSIGQGYKALKGEHPLSAEMPAWDASLTVFEVGGPSLLKAQAELRKAQMYADAAYEAAARGSSLKDLKAALDEAKLTHNLVTNNTVSVPEGEKTEAVLKARTEFDNAAKDLDAAISSSTGNGQDAAKLTKAVEEYSYGVLLRTIQDDKSSEHLSNARDLVGQVKMALPPLPAEMSPKAEPSGAPAGAAAAPTSAGASTATMQSVAGKYKLQRGDPAEKGSFYSIAILELKADGTASLAATMPKIGQLETIINTKAGGKWVLAGDTVTLTLDADETGKPVPAEDKEMKFTVAADLKRLIGGESAEFVRQE